MAETPDLVTEDALDFAKAALAVAWEQGHRDGMADEFALRENPHADIEESRNPYLAKEPDG